MPELASDADFELGRAALAEITPASTIGAPAGSVDEGDGVTTLYFETLLAGYPGWRWTVSIAHVDGERTALETELTPGDDALLSPDWVPWADRLADYRAAQEAAGVDAERLGAEQAEGDDESADGEDDDEDDEDEDDDVLHGGDLDGVDIDEVDPDDDEDDEHDDDLDDHIEDDERVE